MKITKRQLRRIIKEAVGDDFFSDREANPHDDSMYGDPEGGYVPMESFKIPYKNYGYEGRKIIDRDRAWLEFVPKGSPAMTREDMFRAVTLLDSGDEEIELAMATTHAPKFDRRHLENYDVYSVYATTTG
jgi:hypothetical protein